MHIVFASDTNYAEFVSVVIVSVLENTEGVVHFHLLANGIDDRTIEQLRHHIPLHRGELHTYDIQDLKHRLKINVPNTIAISSYARLFLGSILPLTLSKVLYLDCDVVVVNSIEKLWEMDMCDNYVAGVLDTLPNATSKVKVGLSPSDPYINAGVLLINLDLWRKDRLEQLFMDFLMSHNGNVHHHDQGIINGVCKGHIAIISPIYNCTSNYYSHPYKLLERTNHPFYSEQAYDEAVQRPTILHFTEGFYNRPWIANSKHPKAALYHYYHNMTAWRNTGMRKDKRTILVRLLSWEFLHLPYIIYDLSAKFVALIASLIKEP